MQDINARPIRLISVLSMTIDGDTQRIEEAFIGTLKQHNATFLLAYDEPENKGRTLAKVAPTSLVINRQGDTSTILRFTLGQREQAHYQTAEGLLNLGTETSQFLVETNSKGGKVVVDYILYINGQHASNNRLTLNWTL